jgi:hypothetical protein
MICLRMTTRTSGGSLEQKLECELFVESAQYQCGGGVFEDTYQ